jgi:DNA-binding Lrp family transcriptional regulator
MKLDHAIDSLDVKILRIIQEDCQRSQREIAEEINLSAPAVQRRLHRLKTVGIIDRQVAILAPKLLGYPITLIVHVAVRTEQKTQHDAIKRRFLALPQIQQCYYVTGETDFVLIVVTRNMKEYEELSQKLFIEDDNVLSFKTYLVMDRVKNNTSIPV